MDIIKKPYEISLWDDRLAWVRVSLYWVEMNKDKYSPGKYYSQNANQIGAVPYTIDNEPYNASRAYYEIRKGSMKILGDTAQEINIDPINHSSWHKFSLLTEENYNSNKTYYIEEGDRWIEASGDPDYSKWHDAKPIPCAILTYYKEIKLCTIGSNTMSTPIRAVKPKFTSKTSGENTLTFSMYSRYWNEDTSQMEWNPFMMYLTNERKVKLHYDGKWYDFIIKNITEDSSSKEFQYTCKDLFINELSKTGFELKFDNELGNNMGTLHQLAEKILAGSDWKLSDNKEVALQYLEEPLYELTLSNDEPVATIKCSYGEAGYDKEIDFPKGKKVYVFYNSVRTEKDLEKSRFSFLYDPSEKYKKDDKNVLVGYSETEKEGALNCYIENVYWKDLRLNGETIIVPYITNVNGTEVPIGNGGIPKFVPTLKGERLIRSQKTYFDPILKRTVNVYNGGAVYGFKTTDYISPAAVQSYVVNPNSFTSKSGWNVGKANKTDTFPDLSLAVYPELTNANFSNYNGSSYLKFSPTATNQQLMNSGINSNRTSIKSFTQGDKYILTIEGYSLSANGMTFVESGYDVQIFEYTFKDGVYSKVEATENYTPFTCTLSAWTKKYKDGVPYWYTEFVCEKSLSEDAYKKTNIGIFITVAGTTSLYIKNMQFYPYKTYKNESGEEVVCEPGAQLEAIVKDKWKYYSSSASGYTDESTLTYLPENGEYTPYYGASEEEGYEKVRSITAKESNRFNLLQSLCELFEQWCQFEIEHELNGAIKLDENYHQIKKVYYKKYIGKDNNVGFKYGVNLKSIKRTLDSNGTISKIIVKDNTNEFAPSGFCSIARAEENQTGENTIYNFDYYVGQGLINFSQLNSDLYSQPGSIQGYLGYYKQLKALNNEFQEKNETLTSLKTDILKYESEYQAHKLRVDSAERDLADQQIEFKNLTGYEITTASPEYQAYDSELHGNASSSDWGKQVYPWHFYTKDDNGVYTKVTLADDVSPTVGVHYARLKWWDNKEAQKIAAAIAQDLVVKRDSEIIYKNQEALKKAAQAQQSSLNARFEEIKKSKIEINAQFYKKYSRFIQEGSWTKEDYIDDNLYYIDSLSTLYTSSRPQVNYTIEVVELSQIKDYENFNFEIGDKTYVEDKEFFGWAYDGSNRLYREEVIVSETTFELDQPESNKIKVQNYKTQFEDLFQRVVATTQQLQFSTGEYKRGAAIVEPGGIIKPSTLQNSFANNAITLENARNQSVKIGDDGITTTSLSNINEVLRITSGGIFLSNDGSTTWTAGITASGINASCITTGKLNVSNVSITMDEAETFRWDSLGITAYSRTGDLINPGMFTRFDQFGIYGMHGDSNFDPLEKIDGATPGRETILKRIKDNSQFGLTWNDFWLRSNGTDGYVSISADNDFEVIRINSEKQEIPIIKIGRLEKDNSEYYGIKINNQTGGTVFEVDQSGELWLRTKMYIGSNGSEDDEYIYLGKITKDEFSALKQEEDIYYLVESYTKVAESDTFDENNIYYECENGKYVIWKNPEQQDFDEKKQNLYHLTKMYLKVSKEEEFDENKQYYKAEQIALSFGKLNKENYIKRENGVESFVNARKVIDANKKFKVYEDGHIEGTDAHFSGGSTFEGIITATGGTIGGLYVEELSEIGYQVTIESSSGLVLKQDQSTTLKAVLRQGSIEIINDEAKGHKLSYQWWRGDSLIAGETDQTYVVQAKDLTSGTAMYYCKITYEYTPPANQEEKNE